MDFCHFLNPFDTYTNWNGWVKQSALTVESLENQQIIVERNAIKKVLRAQPPIINMKKYLHNFSLWELAFFKNCIDSSFAPETGNKTHQ